MRFRVAIDEHYLLFDPTARLRLRDGPGEPRPTATAAQVLLLAARMPNLQARMLVITAAYTGMRFGELAGLRRAHVHLDRALIHIAADTGALHEVSGERWLGAPKTKAAVRDVRLPAFKSAMHLIPTATDWVLARRRDDHGGVAAQMDTRLRKGRISADGYAP